MVTRISVHSPAPAEVLEIIDAGLDNPSFDDVEPLHAIATDDKGQVIGGAVGRTWGKCCELQKLWVAPEFRERYEGTQLMKAFEREAASRACELVYLDTFSFQAPEFYSKLGYHEAFRTSGFTAGVVKITMQKRLPNGRGSDG